MLAINEPIGRFIAVSNLEKPALLPKHIEQDIGELVDLICLRIMRYPIETVVSGLMEYVFNLRIELFVWLAGNNKELNQYFESFGKHISVNTQILPFSRLAQSVSDVLSAYHTIVSPIWEAKEKLEIKNNAHYGKLQYNMLQFLESHPSPQVRYIKQWVDASLRLELGLIIADLVLTNQVKLPVQKTYRELTVFLINTITRFGAYSIFTGFWAPNDKDTTMLTNRMKILAATIELDNNVNCLATTKEHFHNMVNN